MRSDSHGVDLQIVLRPISQKIHNYERKCDFPVENYAIFV